MHAWCARHTPGRAGAPRQNRRESHDVASEQASGRAWPVRGVRPHWQAWRRGILELFDRMRRIVLASETDWQGWRQASRRLVLAGIEPARVEWSVGGTAEDMSEVTGSFHLPRTLVTLASVAIQARDPDRFGLLYSLVWRTHAGERLLEDPEDPDLSLARRLALAVRA